MAGREVVLCLVVCVARQQLDHQAQPLSSMGLQISVSNIYTPEKRFDIVPNGFFVCSFLTIERPPMKTKYDYKKGNSSCRETVISVQP